MDKNLPPKEGRWGAHGGKASARPGKVGGTDFKLDLSVFNGLHGE